MRPASHDFDVITDAPAPQRRAPQRTEQPPQADADEERRRAALQEHGEKIRAAE
jgi:hypothetical protein